MDQTALYFGRQPNDPHQPRARLYRLTEGPAPVNPPAIDWSAGVSNWGMLGNDRAGDCTAAGAAHQAMCTVFNGQHQAITFNDNQAITMYEAISGYNPADPDSDVGATLQDALGYWRTTGVGDHKILAFAQIDHTDLALVQACIALFGGVYCGFNVPQSAIDQFNSGTAWTVPTKGKASQIVGGHCVPILGYDPTGFKAVTWAQTQTMTTAFFKRYFDEVWVAFSAEWLSRTASMSPQGLDVEQLNADVLALTGTPGPFQQGAGPGPAPDDSSAVALIHTISTQIDGWLRDNA